MFRKILVLLLMSFQWCVLAQQDAWVYFSDKDNVTTSIENPITILTQRAIDRKERHNVAIDERDVPVNETYVTQIKNTENISVLAKSKWFNCVHVRGSQNDIEALLDLEFVIDIEFADRNLNTSRTANLHQDKFEVENTNVDFDYGSAANQIEMLNADTLHQEAYTGEGMLVAVMDSGFPNVDTMGAFQRLRDNGDLLGGYDFVDRTDNPFAFTSSSHGTRVLSDMAGFVQDEFVGTAPDASYILFRTEDVGSENPVEESYWVEALERADSLGVDVANTSLGYKGYDNPNYSYASEDLNGTTAFITRGANIGSEKGLLLIVSAGNSGANGVGAPADAPGVFSIGAVDANGDYASFSSQGSMFQPTQKPDVVARGLQSAVIDQNNNITANNGTSFSSPILAGAMTCFWQAAPNRTNTEIMEFVRASASQFDSPDFFLGYGIPNFGSALNELLSLEEEENQAFRIFPNPVVDELNIRFPFEAENAKVLMFDILGKLIMETSIQSTTNKIDLQSLASGLYLLQLKSSKVNNTFKLVKK